MLKLSQKPGFLDDRGESETGFLPKSWWGCLNYRRNPVSWMIAGALRAGAQKPGFFLNFGILTEIIVETRFLGCAREFCVRGFRNRVSS